MAFLRKDDIHFSLTGNANSKICIHWVDDYVMSYNKRLHSRSLLFEDITVVSLQNGFGNEFAMENVVYLHNSQFSTAKCFI